MVSLLYTGSVVRGTQGWGCGHVGVVSGEGGKRRAQSSGLCPPLVTTMAIGVLRITLSLYQYGGVYSDLKQVFVKKLDEIRSSPAYPNPGPPTSGLGAGAP